MKKQPKFLGEKPSDIYSQFSFKEVWEFINPTQGSKEPLIYEIRMKSADKKDKRYHPRALGNLLKVPYHWTGVFISTAKQFKFACVYGIQNKLTMYLSVNPKRKSIHSKDKYSIERFNGEKQSELGYYNLLIDLDASKDAKKPDSGINTTEQAYSVAKRFLNAHPNIKKYIMIGSGNGVQIRIPLDTPIMLPKPEYDEYKRFIETEETEIYHKLLKISLKETLQSYDNNIISVDHTSFEVARVGRLPFSINWKEWLPKGGRTGGIKKYAGVIEIVDEGENIGLYDHIMSYWEVVSKNTAIIKHYNSQEIAEEFRCDENSIKDAKLTKLLLKENLPEGGRNNVLFFQWKLLLKANDIDVIDPQIKDLVRHFERIQGDHFPINMPQKGNFNPTAIINWCIEKNIRPIYPVLYNYKRRNNINLKTLIDLLSTLEENKDIKELSNGRNITYRILNTIQEKNIIFSNAGLLEVDITRLFWKIWNTYGKEKLEYLVNSGVLKDIIEKFIYK